MSTIPIGSTDKARTAQAVIIVNRATGDLAEAGVGAGTSNTTEATQLLVKAAVESVAANGATSAKQDEQAGTLTDILTELQSSVPPEDIAVLLPTARMTLFHNARATSGETLLIAATASLTPKVYRMVVAAAGAVTVIFKDGSGGAELYRLVFPDKGAYPLPTEADPYFIGTVNTAVYFSTDAAVAVDVQVWAIKEA